MLLVTTIESFIKGYKVLLKVLKVLRIIIKKLFSRPSVFGVSSVTVLFVFDFLSRSSRNLGGF